MYAVSTTQVQWVEKTSCPRKNAAVSEIPISIATRVVADPAAARPLDRLGTVAWPAAEEATEVLARPTCRAVT